MWRLSSELIIFLVSANFLRNHFPFLISLGFICLRGSISSQEHNSYSQELGFYKILTFEFGNKDLEWILLSVGGSCNIKYHIKTFEVHTENFPASPWFYLIAKRIGVATNSWGGRKNISFTGSCQVSLLWLWDSFPFTLESWLFCWLVFEETPQATELNLK